jgi:CheY-like chemotaxis protein
MGMSARESAKSQKTILVVDDDAMILAFVSELLRDGGHTLLTASDGEHALERARSYEGEIHLLLSDFQMPGMSGIELATEINLARPHIKVLLMSGFTGGMLVLNEGWHFLAKPFVASQLRSIVTSLLFPEKSRFGP